MTTTKSIDSYRLTDMEEPTDEMLAQIMREAAEDARKANADATKRFFDEIELPQQSVNRGGGYDRRTSSCTYCRCRS